MMKGFDLESSEMKQYTIQKIKNSDIPSIARFYESFYGPGHVKFKDKDLLEWLLRDPFDNQSYCGFIAKGDDQNILGLIGYALNDYKIGDKVLKGVTPMSWLVSPSARGILGIRLLLKVISLGNFSFALGGTYMAEKTYASVKLKPMGKADVYTKVINIYQFNAYKGYFCRSDFLKSIYFYRRRRNYSQKDLVLQPYCSDGEPLYDSYSEMSILPSRERNKWIMDCPVVESHAFCLEYKGHFMGNCICYISIGNRNFKRGRIVLIPFAGENLEFYLKTIHLLEQYLIENGCSSISMFTMNPSLRKALKSCGYRYSSMLKGYPLFVRYNQEEMKPSDFSNWFVSYYESDKGYLYF